MLSSGNGLFFLIEEVLATSEPLVIIVGLHPETVDPLLLRIQVLVEIVRYVPKSSQLRVLRMLDVFLLVEEALLVLNIFPVIQIGLVLCAALVSEVRQLLAGRGDVPFRYNNEIDDLDLFILHLSILRLELIEFPNQNVNLLSVLRDLVQAITLKLLLFKLNLLVLLLEVPELILKSMVISLFAFEFIDFGGQLVNEEVLVLRDAHAWHHFLDEEGLGRDAMWHCVPRNVLRVPHLVDHVPALS